MVIFASVIPLMVVIGYALAAMCAAGVAKHNGVSALIILLA